MILPLHRVSEKTIHFNRRLVDRRKALDGAGKRPVVANMAVAREPACWCWAVGRMVESAA